MRTTFDDVAAFYAEIRPGYPEQLIEDVITLSEIPQGGSTRRSRQSSREVVPICL
jgi:hypothetical protein